MSAATKKWMQKLSKMNGVVTDRKDVYNNVLRSPSPSVNYIFGKTHGLPFGYSAIFYGLPKGGKSVLSHMIIGQLHAEDPDAIALKIDSEYRSDGQLDDQAMKAFGIDPDRLTVMQTNSPKDVFDQIEKDVAAACQDGAKIRLIIIDSISSVQGRRAMNSESVEDVTIGDHAQTIQIGLQRILPIIRKHDIALIMIAQARAEMDAVEQKRGNKIKMQGSYALQHMAEYFVVVDQNQTVDGRKDMTGKELTDENRTDLAGKAEQTGKKIRVKMKASTMGPAGRTAEFTFDFNRGGIINKHEEVFKLAVNQNIVTRPNQLTYEYGGETWKGKDAFAKALQERPELRQAIVAELIRRDVAGDYAAADKAAEAAMATEDEE